MSSGYGVRGGTGRCYPFWMDYTNCVRASDNPRKCKAACEDYEECMHNQKEIKYRNAVAAEAVRQGIDIRTFELPEPIPDPPADAK